MEERSIGMEVKIKSMKYEEFNDNEYLEQLRASGTNVIVGCLDGLLLLPPAAVVLNSWQWERHVTISPDSGLR